MKYYFIWVLILLGWSPKSFSQSITPISKLYLNTGIMVKPQRGSDGTGGELGFSVVVRNKWSFTFSFHDLTMNPSNLPKDFDPGYSEGFALILPYSGPDLDPNISCKLYSITMGRYYPLGKRSWFQLEGGPSFVSSYKTSFTSQPVTSGSVNYLIGYENYTTSNYTMKKEKKSGMGLLLRADIQQAISRHLAMGVSFHSCLSGIQSPLFFEVRMLGGHFGIPRKTKKTN